MKEPAKRIYISASIGIFLMLASYFAEYILDLEGISPADTLLDNILIGVSAGLLVYTWATLLTEREARNFLIEGLRHEAVSEERHRLAREVHDTVAQAFMAISLQLEAAKDDLDSNNPKEAQARINKAQSMAREGLAEARRVVWALHPEALEGEDLASALQRLTNRITERRSISAEFIVHGDPYPLPGEVEANMLRIAQEALSNALKHSGARRVRVELAYGNEEAHLVVRDDGKGFHAENQKTRRGFGLTSMRERCRRIGAQLSIESRRGAGTRIELTFPCHIPAQNDVPEENSSKIQEPSASKPE